MMDDNQVTSLDATDQGDPETSPEPDRTLNENTRRQLYAFLNDLVGVTVVKVSDVAGLTGIQPHEIADLLVALGGREISPGSFDYKEALDALRCDSCAKRHHPLRKL